MLKNLLLSLLCSILLFSISFATKKHGDLLMKQPYLSVHIDISGCAYEVLVNDVPIMTDEDGIPVIVTIPVNEWMKSGKNTLSMKLSPVKDNEILHKQGQSCRALANLQVRGHGTPASENIVLDKLIYKTDAMTFSILPHSYQPSTVAGKYAVESNKFERNEQGNIELSKIELSQIKGKYGHGVDVKRSIDMPLAFPEWAWFKGEKIADNEQTKEELVKQYQKIWDALEHKNLNGISDEFRFRSRELSDAYYQKTSDNNTLNLLKDNVHSSKLELQPFYPKYAKLEVFGNGHLAKLVAWDNESVIFFNYTNEDSSSSFDITFSKINGKWVITR